MKVVMMSNDYTTISIFINLKVLTNISDFILINCENIDNNDNNLKLSNPHYKIRTRGNQIPQYI